MFDSIRRKVFNIKETSAPEYFLGGYFEHVKEPKTDIEVLTWGSKTHVKRTMETFNNNFYFEPYEKHATTTPDYNSDIDTTDLFNGAEKVKYWQCIGDM